jgi:Concanavalin A-like lectin/glucanases superfamily
MRHGLFRSAILVQELPQPLWSQVVLASHFDGTGTTLVDLKGSTMTASGNATQSATISKFGGKSLYNGDQLSGNGITLSALTTPTLLAHNGDFTIECWFYQLNNTEYDFCSLISRIATSSRADAASSSLELGVYYIGGVYKPHINVYNTSTGNFAPGGNLTTTLNTWNHVAVTRNSNVLRLWVNGALSVTSGTITGTVSTPSSAVQIGMSQGRHSFRGYIDDIRVVHGVGLYTAPFTPPTAPFPNS